MAGHSARVVLPRLQAGGDSGTTVPHDAAEPPDTIVGEKIGGQGCLAVVDEMAVRRCQAGAIMFDQLVCPP